MAVDGPGWLTSRFLAELGLIMIFRLGWAAAAVSAGVLEEDFADLELDLGASRRLAELLVSIADDFFEVSSSAIACSMGVGMGGCVAGLTKL